MARDYFVNGETMVYVKSRVDSAIASLSELGLSDGPIRPRWEFRHKDIQVDAFGAEIPPEIQFMLAAVRFTMTLIHYDEAVLDECMRLSTAGAPAVGQMPRAGSLMGNGVARFAAGNNFIGLNLASPVGQKPYRFYFAYLAEAPMEKPMGTEKTILTLNWRAIPYQADPWGGGFGSLGAPLWDNILDT